MSRAVADQVVWSATVLLFTCRSVWHIAAPDVCDGTSAVGESRHRIPWRIRWSTDWTLLSRKVRDLAGGVAYL